MHDGVPIQPGIGLDAVAEADSGSNHGLATSYLNWLETVRHRAGGTIYRYASILDAFSGFLGRDYATAEVHDFERFQVRPRSRRGKGTSGSASTQKQEIVCLRGFYKWLLANGVIEQDPTLLLYTPTVKNVNPKPVRDDVWRELWTPSTLTTDALLTLGLGGLCGLRRNEMVSLEPWQIQGGMIIDFVRKGGGEDSLPWETMVDILTEELPHLYPDTERFKDALRAASGTKILDLGSDPDQVNKLLSKLTARRGTDHVHPHMLRHQCCTNLLRAGVPVHLVSSLLNHSSLEITTRYVKAGIDELHEWRHRTRR